MSLVDLQYMAGVYVPISCPDFNFLLVFISICTYFLFCLAGVYVYLFPVLPSPTSCR